jgi:hypothetical protein
MWTNPIIIQIILDSPKDEDDIDSASGSDSSNDEEDVQSDQSKDESQENYLNLFSQ